MICKIDLK